MRLFESKLSKLDDNTPTYYKPKKKKKKEKLVMPLKADMLNTRIKKLRRVKNYQ